MPSEIELIERFLAPFDNKGAAVVLGPGDDCAIVGSVKGSEQCVTMDAVVEGVHFDRRYFRPADIGHKALAVNLSDLAAMGARPTWFLCSIACPPKDARLIGAIARGMAKLAQRAKATLVGGNFSRADVLSIHVTAAGELPAGSALRRSGARPGDLVYVTGTLGDSALALQLLAKGRAPGPALDRQTRPEPRLQAGQLARRFASAAIDISDGLIRDTGHLARASKVAVRLDASRLPRSPFFTQSGADLGLALSGGEDYELLLSVPATRARPMERAFARAGELLTRIGSVARGGGVKVLNAPMAMAGKAGAQSVAGFDHFVLRIRRQAPSAPFG